jgi:plastocyanin
MRLVRLSIIVSLALLALVLAYPAVAAASTPPPPRTYAVLVGAENVPRGIDIMAFFPSKVTIHAGDSILWIQNSNEIHTVTFLGGTAPPELLAPAAVLGLPTPPVAPGPLVFNPLAVNRTAPPAGLGNDTTFVNSGLMGRETGQYRSFELRFTAEGTYHYLCLVHGEIMSGTIEVVDPDQRVASPGMVKARGLAEIARQMAKAPAVIREARRQISPPTVNPDGTMTHYVNLGFSDGQIDLMSFVPKKLWVRPGDTVVWQMTPASDAPHTVTFLNGTPEPDLVVPFFVQQNEPPLLYINPAVLAPSQPVPDLMRTGYYNSGLLLPAPGTMYSLIVGDVAVGPLHYLCQLHDTSGMRGTLFVLPK